MHEHTCADGGIYISWECDKKFKWGYMFEHLLTNFSGGDFLLKLVSAVGAGV